MVIDALELVHFTKDSFIIKENEEGSEIFVSNRGQFLVIKGDEIVKTFGEGTVFGELAILYNAKRLASIKSKSLKKISCSILTDFISISCHRCHRLEG